MVEAPSLLARPMDTTHAERLEQAHSTGRAQKVDGGLKE